MAKAKAPKREAPQLVAINIPEVKALLRKLEKKETDAELVKSIKCLEEIFDHIYGNVLVCKSWESKLGPWPACCGMC